MATYQKTESGKWKALVRRRGRRAQARTFEKKAAATRWAIGLEESIHKEEETRRGARAGARAPRRRPAVRRVA